MYKHTNICITIYSIVSITIYSVVCNLNKVRNAFMEVLYHLECRLHSNRLLFESGDPKINFYKVDNNIL